MKKITFILLSLILLLSVPNKAFSQKLIIDRGDYVDLVLGSTPYNDTISILKSKYLYTRQQGVKLYLIFNGYGGKEVKIETDTTGFNVATLGEFRKEVSNIFNNRYIWEKFTYSGANVIEIKKYVMDGFDTTGAVLYRRDTIPYSGSYATQKYSLQ